MKFLSYLFILVISCSFSAVLQAQPCGEFSTNLHWQITQSTPILNTGDEFYLDMSVTGFNEIAGFQFTFNYDPRVIQFSEVDTIGFPLPGPIANNSTESNTGNIGFLWTSINAEGESLATGTKLFRIHFTAIGEPGDQTDIILSRNLADVEVFWLFDDLTLCTDRGPLNLDSSPIVIACPNFTVSSTLCPTNLGPNSASAILAVSICGGQPSYEYTLSNTTGFVDLGLLSSSENEIIYDSLSYGTYTLKVTAINDQTISQTLDFQQNQNPPLEIEIIANEGNDITYGLNYDLETNILGGDGNYYVAWSSGVYGINQISGYGYGTYSATVTDGTGCTARNQIIVSSPNFDCTIDTILGANELDGTYGSLPPNQSAVPIGPLCPTGALNNPSYYSFIADSEEISFTIEIINCENNNNGFFGIQANVTDICNAAICYGDSVAECFEDVLNFTASAMTVGQAYQLVLDGCGGSVCEYKINVQPYESELIVQNGPGFFFDQSSSNFIFTEVNCPYPVSWELPSGADFLNACSSTFTITQTNGPESGSDFDQGLTPVCYIFQDDCGTQSSEICFEVSVNCIGSNTSSFLDNCLTAEVFCNLEDLNGLQIQTESGDGSDPTESLCGTGGLDKPIFYSFIANTDSITFNITNLICTASPNGAFGLQAAIIQSCEPDNCLSDAGSLCFTEEFMLTATSLTIGQEYQLLFDGCFGSSCIFTITHDLDESTQVQIPTPSEPQIDVLDNGPICNYESNVISICNNSTLRFVVGNLETLSYGYCWSIDQLNGVAIENSSIDCTSLDNFNCPSNISTCAPLELSFSALGNYNICLTQLLNKCETIEPSNFCYQITVTNPIETFFPSVNICAGQKGTNFTLPQGPNGNTWQEFSSELVSGLNVFEFEDDCGCLIREFIEVNFIEAATGPIEEVILCPEDLENWTDLGISFEDIAANYDPTTGIVNNVLIPGASNFMDSNQINCDSIISYQFLFAEINGTILEQPFDDCASILSFENNSNDFISEENLVYQWSINGQLISEQATLLATDSNLVELTVIYELDNAICNKVFSYTPVDTNGLPPNFPVFDMAPDTVCVNDFPITFSVTQEENHFYNWILDNATANTIDSNVIMVTPEDGINTIEISVASNNGCGQIINSTILTILDNDEAPCLIDGTTGLNEGNFVDIYFDSETKDIQFILSNSIDYWLTIFNAQGKLINKYRAYQSTQISTMDWSTGIYFLQVVDPKNEKIQLTKLFVH